MARDRTLQRPRDTRPGLAPIRPLWRRRRVWVTVLVVAAVAVAAGAVAWAPRHWNRCGFSLTERLHVWTQDGETGCVGVTDGEVAFDPQFSGTDLDGRFGALLRAIKAENDKVASGKVEGDSSQCDVRRTDYVDVAAVAPWRSDLVGGRAFHELEGMYIAQYQANHLRQPTGCQPYIRLLIADPGPRMSAWREVADELTGYYPKLVAVVGLAVSRTEIVGIARRIDDAGIPVVADLVTADGFDRTNFADAGDCAPPPVAPGSLKHFYRLTYANRQYLDALGRYLREQHLLDPGSAVQLTQESDGADSFACTNVAHVNELLDPAPDPITFQLSSDDNDPTGQIQTKVTPVCADPGVRTLFYTARAKDLANVVLALDRACPNGIVLAGGTDSTRLLTPERDPTAENKRRAALRVLQAGRVKLYYVAAVSLAQIAGERGYADFRAAFTAAFHDVPDADLFPLTDLELADTWILNAHDALYLVANAVHALHANKQDYTPRAVAGNLSGYELTDAAQGNLRFDSTGTRIGNPTVVRLCSDGVTPTPVAVDGPTTCPADPPQ
jgi:hypothetical protein